MKKPRNKKYVPKPIAWNGGIGAIGRAREAIEIREPLTDEQVRDLSTAFRIAFDGMISGRADEQNWSTCVCSLNIALVLAERGTGDEYTGQIVDALAGAFRARTRANKTGVWGFDGEAITAIKSAYEVHEAQLECSTKEELRNAIQEVHRRAAAGNVFKEEIA